MNINRYEFVFALLAVLLGCGGATFSTGCGEEFVSTPGTDAGTGGEAAAGAGGNTGGSAGTAGSGNDAGAGAGGDAGHAGQGGTAGSGGTAGGGGDAGQGGTAGAGGQGGTAGGGGQGGAPPCETGKYATIESVSASGPLANTAGAVTLVTFLVHGTSNGDGLDNPVTFVNNTQNPANPGNPMPTTALENTIIRCQDPNGTSNYTDACNLNMTTGQDTCTPGCYSASSGDTRMQIQIDPASGQSGAVRIIAGAGLKVCDDQTQIPIRTIQ